MGSKKIACNSQANIKATTTATWNIDGWEGPFQDLIRSQAACYVSLGESPVETVDLRFYLRYVENQDNPAFDANAPMCKTGAKFSGYSLMMDVLSDHKEKLMISVTGKKLQGEESSFDTKKGGVIVEPNSIKTGLTVIKVFNRCEIWDEDKDGAVCNYELLDTDPYDLNISTSDGIFVLMVSSYKMENTGPDNPKLNQCQTTENDFVSELAQDLTSFQFEPENFSDFVLTSKDGMIIRAHRFILAARSPYFCRVLQDGATSLSVDVLAKPLLALLHWIYTGEVQNSWNCYLGSIAEAAAKFEIPSILKALDNQLIKLVSTENMFMLAEFAKKYGMKKAADDLAKFIKCNISTWLTNPYSDIDLKDTETIHNSKASADTAYTNPPVPVQQNRQPEIQNEFSSSSTSLSTADQPSESDDQDTSSETTEAGKNSDVSNTRKAESPQADKNKLAKSNRDLENDSEKGADMYQAMLEVVKLNEVAQKIFRKCNAEPDSNSNSEQELLDAKRDMKDLNKTLSKYFFGK